MLTFHGVALAPLVLALAVANGYAYRLGGDTRAPGGTQAARLLCRAPPLALLLAACQWAGLLAGPWWLPALAWADIGLVLAATPHGVGHELAVPWTGPAPDALPRISRSERLGYLAEAGVTRWYALSLVLVPTDPRWVWLGVAGIGHAAAYLVALYWWRSPLPKPPQVVAPITQNQELGEWCWGFLQVLLLAGFVFALTPARTR